MKKRATALILVTILCAQLLACGSLLDSAIGGGDSSPPETQTTDDTPTSTPSPEPGPDGGDPDPGSGGNPPISANIGDVIPFGAYDWRVLDVQGDRALLISEYITDYIVDGEVRPYESHPYHVSESEYDDITWEGCTLRSYLNGEFLSGFSPADQARIIATTLINNNNQTYNTPGGNDTTDRIFLLSADEAEQYFANDADRIAQTSYGEDWFWRLRSPGSNARHAAYVEFDGSIISSGAFIYDNLYGIRPALWLALGNYVPAPDPAPGNGDPTDGNTVDIIPFGGYDWRVLDVQGDRALLISEGILERRVYHSPYGDITWEHSSIRDYLNGEFLSGLSPADQARIIETTLINNNNPTYDTPGGNDTVDKIFLLSIDEAQLYFADDADRLAYEADGGARWWWLRSPGIDATYVACVETDYNDSYYPSGGISDIGMVLNDDSYGVRPALWLELP